MQTGVAIRDSCSVVSILTTVVTKRTKWRGRAITQTVSNTGGQGSIRGQPVWGCGGCSGIDTYLIQSYSVFLHELSLYCSSLSYRTVGAV